MTLSGIDLKRLKVFLAVVECGGFSAAEHVLNISQSTISENISELESRLGYRLCERGRGGFALTDRGTDLHERAVRLLQSLSDFEDGARALKGALAGHLRLALIDNLISDPSCPLVAALAALRARPGGAPRITIDVLSPADIEHAVAVGRVDLGVSIVEKRLPTLAYDRLYVERDVLVCGERHPLYYAESDDQIRREVRVTTKVVRSFLHHHDFSLMSDREDSIRATVTSVEAAAFLILAGTHIGFLPTHYAEHWIAEGQMRALLPNEFRRESEIALIRRVDAPTHSAVLKQFLNALEQSRRENPLAPRAIA